MPVTDPHTPTAPFEIDYPPTIRKRWGGVDSEGNPNPGCGPIERLLKANEHRIEAFVRSAGEISGVVVRDVPLEASHHDPSPRWNQTWMPALDAISIVTAIGGWGGTRNPATYLEIGSGHSTRFARRAIEVLGLSTQLASIDPEPRAEIDAICDTVVRDRLEDCDLGVFDSLAPGDVVFFDGSHRCLQNSDVTVFFLEVLPRLPKGVLIGVHDVFWPGDYPPGFAGRWYSEQYVLGAYLLGLGDRARIHMATNALNETQRAVMLGGIPESVRTKIPNLAGASLWFEVNE